MASLGLLTDRRPPNRSPAGRVAALRPDDEAPKRSGGGWAVLTLLAGLGVGVLVFFLYYRTLAPTMLYYDPAGMYDSLMLQVKAAVLGIPNPTGYPTYIMLAHLFTYLPVEGGVGYRVNLASAVFGAAAVGVVFLVCRLLTGRLAPALVGAFLFGVSRVFWSQAVIAEVYTLNALFIALDLLALLLWRKTGRDRYLLLFALLMGLTMTNHMTSGLVLPAAALFVALTDWRRLLDLRLVLRGTGLFFAGLLPYLYLPVRAMMDPPLNETDPSTPERFLALVTGSNFQSRMFAFEWDQMPGRISLYAGHLAEQFNPLFIVVAAFGALALSYRRDAAALAMLVLLYLGWLVYGMHYDIRDYFIYFIPTYLILCIFVACGLGAALDIVFASARSAKEASARLPGLHRVLSGGPARTGGLAVAAVLSLGMLYLPLPGLEKVYKDVDMSEDFHGLHIMNAVMEGTAPNATVVQNGGVMYYMQYVAEERSDLQITDPFPAGGWQATSPLWVMGAVEALGEGRRAYVIFPSRTAESNEYLFWSSGYELIEDESGFFYEVVPRERNTRELRSL